MNVVLVGYRGTGKSACAAQLAIRLGLRVISLDAEIERQAGLRIPDIVAQRGWPGFRDLEEAVVRQAAAQDGWVIDCGGGVVEREANFPVLRAAGPVIWLKATTHTIVGRIQGDTQRPSLTGTRSFTDEVSEVLQRRTPLYQRLADFQVDTDDAGIDAVVGQIVAWLAARTATAGERNGTI
jgi:shikimate kinase